MQKLESNCLVGAKALITENKQIPDNSLICEKVGSIKLFIVSSWKNIVREKTTNHFYF